MGVELGLADFLKEAKEIRDSIGTADDAREKRLDGLERSMNDVLRKVSRPGFGGGDRVDDLERKDAIEYCILRHELDVPKTDGQAAYTPSSAEIENAVLATRGLHTLFRTGNPDRAVEYRKALSSFAFGSNQFILAPEMSNRILSCLVDPSDVAGLMGQSRTSHGSLKFLIDNSRMGAAGWACEVNCFPNNPMPDLQEGLGELEIKPETLRHIICATSDLLADASFNVEARILQKASQGFRDTINAAIVNGDGIGKPLGLLHPSAGIPVCETSAATQAGQFTWQDCVSLAYEVPMQYHGGASFLLNQRTWALMMTMSDASGRPL
jgi:HK97 family phage major capsid protein